MLIFEASSDRSRNKGFLSISCFALCGRVQFAGRSGSEQRVWFARFAEPVEQDGDNDICTSGNLAHRHELRDVSQTARHRASRLRMGHDFCVASFFNDVHILSFAFGGIMICQVNVLVIKT